MQEESSIIHSGVHTPMEEETSIIPFREADMLGKLRIGGEILQCVISNYGNVEREENEKIEEDLQPRGELIETPGLNKSNMNFHS